MLILQCMDKVHSFDAARAADYVFTGLRPALDKVNIYAVADCQERLYECEGNRDIWVRTFNLLLVPDAHHGFMNPSTTTPQAPR